MLWQQYCVGRIDAVQKFLRLMDSSQPERTTADWDFTVQPERMDVGLDRSFRRGWLQLPELTRGAGSRRRLRGQEKPTAAAYPSPETRGGFWGNPPEAGLGVPAR